ncbi:aminotransferase class III-fold pyridoxal phosphate-dependent enzyme [Nanoarchaeota archaeon]
MIENFKKSKLLLEEAKKIIPTASQTYSKSYRYFCEGAAPAFLDRGLRGHVWDIDGNEYIDFVLGLGPITIGYHNDEVDTVVRNQLQKGIIFSQPTVLEVDLARKLCGIIPCAEMVKFVKNGSDATTVAVRLARAFTGREVIACCGYHGYHDWYIATRDNDKGIPESVKELTCTFDYNDIASLATVFDQNPNKVAAVILEPCQGEGPKDGFLEALKKMAHRNGALVIFDEVVSGFRMGIGGAQQVYGVTPDLSSFGKGMGNGLPISAVVGRADILKLIDAGVFVSTTFGGDALSLAGSLKTIEILERPSSFPHIHTLGQLWIDKVEKLIEVKGISEFVGLSGLTPHCGVVFRNIGSLLKTDLLSVYQQTLIQNGILSIGINNFCLEHTKEDVEKFIDAVDQALDITKEAVSKDSVEGLLKGKKIRPIFARRLEDK